MGSGIDVDEGSWWVVLGAGGAGQDGDVQIRQLRPAHVAAVQRALIEKFGAVASQKMKLLDARGTQELSDLIRAQLRIAQQPAPVLHPVVEQHCVRFSDRVVAKPSELE